MPYNRQDQEPRETGRQECEPGDAMKQGWFCISSCEKHNRPLSFWIKAALP
ncbi:MAG: hypothetical protein GX754_01670 [Clostridiaceae bacterium]|nr:hypothetical protein [Clostridiaceae bacterium]